MPKPYVLTNDQKMQFAGIFVLEYMINKPHEFPLLLSKNDQDLETILEWLLVNELIQIKQNESYSPTDKGRESLNKFIDRYSEFLNVFDIFCAVDLETGEFAFESYFDFDDKVSWDLFLREDRWDNLRIAVADYKKLNPVEIVFMSFISENRFGRNQTGWQFDLLLGTVWDEILEICQTAIQWDELGFEDEEGIVPAEAVIEDIIVQGAKHVLALQKKEMAYTPKYLNDYNDQSVSSSNGEADKERIIVTENTVEYYDPYLDPIYVSPIWFGFWF